MYSEMIVLQQNKCRTEGVHCTGFTEIQLKQSENNKNETTIKCYLKQITY